MSFNTMDIYSSPGTKVRYKGQNGYNHDKDHANRYLVVDQIYTVNFTDVHSSTTDVYLREVPNTSFNSVMFEAVGV